MASRAERETIIRWDAETGEATVYTADLQTMRRLTKRGYAFREVSQHSWQAVAPKRAVTLRRLPMKGRQNRFVGQEVPKNGGLSDVSPAGRP
jgi:hypothetical protein